MKLNAPRLSLWLAVLLALAGLLRAVVFYVSLHEPLLLEDERFYLVRPGQSLSRVVGELAEQGVLERPFDLRVYARLSGGADRIQAGEYRLSPGLTPLQLLDKLGRGEVHYRQVVIVEGWTAAQALAALHANPYIENTIPDGAPETLRQALGLDGHPEGRFFPDTYNFTRGASDRDILLRAHALMQDVLAQEWAARDVGLPYADAYQALVMASLVEKETAVPDERAQIAGVFVRRLQRNMRLQTDPTVIYGLGARFDGNLTRADLREDNPYNTYVNRGLPPTPIALPGREAIAASLHPASGGELYFVARGDGTHHFSSTLEEHNAAVQRYQLGSGAAAAVQEEAGDG